MPFGNRRCSDGEIDARNPLFFCEIQECRATPREGNGMTLGDQSFHQGHRLDFRSAEGTFERESDEEEAHESAIVALFFPRI